MPSDDSGPRAASPIVLRIKLRYEDAETMVQRFAIHVGKSGLFLPTKSLQPVGAEVKFELRLADDAPALVGLGRVKAATPPDPDDPEAAFGMAIELMRVTQPSRALILRMLERRRELGLPELGLPMAADIDAARATDDELDEAERASPAASTRAAESAPSAGRTRAAASSLPAASPGAAGSAPLAGRARAAASALPAASPPETQSVLAAVPGREVERASLAVPGREVERASPAVPGREVERASPAVPGREVERASPAVPGREAASTSPAGCEAASTSPAVRAAASTPPPALETPGEVLLTAPRKTTAQLPSANALGLAPLSPEPARRKRVAVGDLIDSASGPVPAAALAVPGLDDEVDVAAAIARARALAGSGLDSELEALSGPVAAPVAISVDAASAELARQLGGSAIRRDRTARWVPPPTTTPAVGSSAGLVLVSGESTAATPASGGASDVQSTVQTPVVAGTEVLSTAPTAIVAGLPAADVAFSDALLTAQTPVVALPDEPGAAEPGAAEPVAEADSIEDALSAMLSAIQQPAVAVEEPVRGARSPRFSGGPLDAQLEVLSTLQTPVVVPEPEALAEDAASPSAELPAVAQSITDEIQQLDEFDLEDAEHTELGDAPEGANAFYGYGASPSVIDEVMLAARLEAQLAEAEAEDLDLSDRTGQPAGAIRAAGGRHAGGDDAHDLSLEEIEDFEILSEADADEDSPGSSGLGQQVEARSGGRRIPSDADFASNLDLGDSDRYFAMSATELPRRLHDDPGRSDLHRVSAGHALAAFEYDDSDERELLTPHRVVQPIFEPEQSSSFTLAQAPTDSLDLEPSPPREPVRRDATPARPEPAPVRRDATPARPEPAPVRRDATPARPEPAPVRRDATPGRRDATPVRRDATPVRRAGTPSRGSMPLTDAESLYDSPVEDFELEHALEALDVDLDDLSIPEEHAAAELAREAAAPRARSPSGSSQARPAGERIAARPPTNDDLAIDFEEEEG